MKLFGKTLKDYKLHPANWTVMKKEAAFSAALAVLVLSLVLLASCTLGQQTPPAPQQAQALPSQQQQQPQPVLEAPQGISKQQLFQQQEVKVEAKPYKHVTEKLTGWFKSGQDADVELYATGFGESGGPLIMNHPSKVATEGRRLIVSDTWNNRVLVWNEIPTKSNQLPDLVLGQNDFYSNTPGLGANRMNWPMGVATDGTRLLVGDGFNDRVLIWNTFPTRNGQPADIVLGASDFDTWPNYLDRTQERNPKTRIYWPWDVWTDGQKVMVTSTVDGSVLVWNSFPTRNNQPADLMLGYEDFSTRFVQHSENPMVDLGTPRAITFDGTHLVVGDYSTKRAFVWNGFPTRNGQAADFIIQVKRVEDEPYNDIMGVAIKDNRLFASSAHQVYVWNSFPEHGEKEDVRVGQTRPESDSGGMSGPFGVTTDGKRLIVADTNNNRVLIFDNIPAEPGAKADIVLGQPGFGVNTFMARNSCGGPGVYSNGEQLAIGCDFGRRIYVYSHLPDESKAEADVVINATWLGGVQQAIIAGGKLIAANREAGRILIWNNVPVKDNKLPDVILGISTDLEWWRNGKGRTELNNPVSVATDGKRLFVSDWGNNRILIWDSIPASNQTPADLVFGQPDFDSTSPGEGLNQLDSPYQVSTDGKRLVVADSANNRILVWKSIPTTSGQPADFQIKIIDHSTGSQNWFGLPQYARLAGPQGAFIYNDSLFVGDVGNNRVLVWAKFPESETDEPDIVLGQKDFQSNYPSNTKSGLFMPSFVSFDGSFLWVGEVKWSNRLLRFSVRPG